MTIYHQGWYYTFEWVCNQLTVWAHREPDIRMTNDPILITNGDRYA